MLANYLSGVEVQGRVTHVDRTGWHEIDGHQVFVLPDETIGPVRLERVVLDTPATCAYETRGTLDDWQAGICTLARGHALPVLAISVALAGPLLHHAGQEGGGINIFGQSSKGSTRSSRCRVAMQRWKATLERARSRSRRLGAPADECRNGEWPLLHAQGHILSRRRG